MSRAGDGDRIGLKAAVGLGVLVLAVFLAVTTEISPVGLLPQLTRDYGVTPSIVGLLLSVYAALVAVLAVPLTLLTARLPRKPLLLGTIALYAIGNACIALAPNFAMVCVGRAFGGAAHALFFSVAAPYAVGLVPRRMQGRAITIAYSGGSIGYVLGVPLVTAIGAGAGQRAAFGALALGAVLVTLVTARLLPPIRMRQAGMPAGGEPTVAAGARRLLGIVAGVNVLAFFGQYCLYTYVAPMLLESGLPEQALSAVLFVLGASGVVGLLFTGLVIDRRPRAGLLVALALCAVFVALLLLLRGGSIGTITATACWTLIWGGVPGFFAAACLRIGALSQDVAAAVNNAASNVGIGAGAAVGGAAFALGGLSASITLAAASFGLAMVLVWVLRGVFPPGPPHPEAASPVS